MPNKKTNEAKRPAPGSKIDTAMLESVVGYNLRRAASLQRSRFKSAFGPYAIRPVQLSILILLHNNPGLKQSALGKSLDIKRANVVTLLDELEERGLVARCPSETDRRAHVLQFTPAGRKLTTKLLDLHVKLENDLARALGGEEARDKLVSLLKIYRNLDPEPSIE
jgi:DNA-binding MarR family transcriptional regulator